LVQCQIFSASRFDSFFTAFEPWVLFLFLGFFFVVLFYYVAVALSFDSSVFFLPPIPAFLFFSQGFLWQPKVVIVIFFSLLSSLGCLWNKLLFSPSPLRTVSFGYWLLPALNFGLLRGDTVFPGFFFPPVPPLPRSVCVEFCFVFGWFSPTVHPLCSAQVPFHRPFLLFVHLGFPPLNLFFPNAPSTFPTYPHVDPVPCFQSGFLQVCFHSPFDFF